MGKYILKHLLLDNGITSSRSSGVLRVRNLKLGSAEEIGVNLILEPFLTGLRTTI